MSDANDVMDELWDQWKADDAPETPEVEEAPVPVVAEPTIADAQHDAYMQTLQAQRELAELQKARLQEEQSEEDDEDEEIYLTQENLDAGIENDLVGTFKWIAENAEQYIPQLISTVRRHEEFGHDIADKMQFDYFRYKQQQQQYEFDSYREKIEADKQKKVDEQKEFDGKRQAVATTINQMREAYGESFIQNEEKIHAKVSEQSPRMLKWCEDNNVTVTPQIIKEFITNVYFEVRNEEINNAKARMYDGAHYAETPTGLQAVEASEDDKWMADILDTAEQMGKSIV